MRNNIKGNYKGYIYCDGLDEAKLISDSLNEIVKKPIHKILK